ncbi:unnamed protein product [Thlaspi arvense]|uniref:Uncharacterized protein n=1 Tax=Thlaspi arvense TaxID=13288 RepID=A0AAU9SK82_THLAR|nr:unnamed protein product [Thlaspi arvense]
MKINMLTYKENVQDICSHLLGDVKKKVPFCWENRKSNLMWKKGDYSESDGGDTRMYLKKLVEAENDQEFI